MLLCRTPVVTTNWSLCSSLHVTASCCFFMQARNYIIVTSGLLVKYTEIYRAAHIITNS